MNKIFLVLSTLKHNGEEFLKGALFQGDLAEFESLVKAGVLKIVEGAQTLEEAAGLVKTEVEAAAAKAEAAKTAAPQDQWAPKPNETAQPSETTPADQQPAATVDQTTPPAETTQPAAPAEGAAPAVGAGDQPPAEPAVTGDNL